MYTRGKHDPGTRMRYEGISGPAILHILLINIHEGAAKQVMQKKAKA